MKNVEDIYPLSPLQEGMLFHALKAPDSGAYFEQYYCRLAGDFQPDHYRRAWQTVIERHKILRTAFLWQELEQPLQVVRRHVALDWVEEDLSALEPYAYDHWLNTYLDEDRARPFDFAKAPLMRFRLFRLGQDDYQWIWSYHHMLSDGWSTAIILDEVSRAYELLVQGKQNGGPANVAPYRDFVAWLQRADLSGAERFWKEKLKGVSGPTTLPLRRPVASDSGYQQIGTTLSGELTQALVRVAKQYRITLNTLIQGAWAILLYRYAGDKDVLFGATVSGRSAALEGIERMVGLFINTLPVRVKIEPEQPFSQWLADLQVDEIKARAYEYSPLSRIQSWSHIGPGKQLFESIVVFENYPDREKVNNRLPGVALKDVGYKAHSNYPLAFIVMPDNQMRLIIVYDRSRFDYHGVHRIFGHVSALLQAFVENPERPIKALAIAGEKERHLLASWQKNDAGPAAPNSVLKGFESTAVKHPQAMAVVCGGENIRYKALNQRANQLAHLLLANKRAPGSRIGIFLHRCTDMITAILGVIKSGAAYVPLDPTYPSERLGGMIADAQIDTIVTLRSMMSQIPESDADLILVDDPQLSNAASENPDLSIGPDDPAYVIYTSGSTGRPKGVMITHGNLAYSTTARMDYYQGCPSRFLLLSSISFDSSVAGIFWTLCGGGTLHVPEQENFKDIQNITTLVEKQQITHLLCIPSLYDHMLTSYQHRLVSLETVITAGEACPPALVRRHFTALPEILLYNEYGPTEATVWSTVYRCRKNAFSNVVPIGRPIAETQIFILDRDRQLTPVGIPGEIYIGGPGVAQGYLNRPAITAEQFIFQSIDGEPPRRLYRTGDLAYYTEDGYIVFTGRRDEQAKVRGYRIELGEISNILDHHEDVCASAVLLHTDRQKRNYVVAYVVPRDRNEALVPALRETLGAQLPDFMMPANIILVDDIPLTVNGKIDRPALWAMGRNNIAGQQHRMAPRNELEKRLVQIWQKLLDLDTVGVTDNFFELGGDSMLAIRLVSEIQETIGKEIRLAVLFRNPTIDGLARATSERTIPTGNHLIAPIHPKGDKYPLFLIQGTDTIHLFLQTDQPVYRLLSLYDDIEMSYNANTIEKIAADYIQDVRRYFPEGPYVFCGFSAGAIIAVEMSRQLRERYNETSHLFLLEPTPPSMMPTISSQGAAAPTVKKMSPTAKLIKAMRQGPAHLMKLVTHKLKRRLRIPMVVYYGLFKFYKALGVSIPRRWRMTYALRWYVNATNRYRPESYREPCTLCLSASHENAFPWHRIFTGDLHIHRVEEARKHLDLTHNKEIIKIWANHLNRYLDKMASSDQRFHQ